MTKMTAFKESWSNPTHIVASMVNTARKEQVSRNTKVIKSLLKCAAFCGKQGISLCGHRDDSTVSESVNTGNFIQLVQFRAENDVLHTFLETAPRNALYTSITIQNEMISVLGSAIQDKLIQEVKSAQKNSILADKVLPTWNMFRL